MRRLIGIGSLLAVYGCAPTPVAPVEPTAVDSPVAPPSSTAVEASRPTSSIAPAASSPLAERIDGLAQQIEPDVVAYRRDLHQHPELGNREHRTAKVIAEHLRRHGWEVRDKVAYTGLVAVLRGGKPGPVVALRAEMDGLPVREEVDVPFASKATAPWRGEQTPVMHACGHDMHMAIVMGAAQVLAELQPELPGTVVLLFQPAEEGAPVEEGGGAQLMVEQGALQDPTPEAIFGLHVVPEPVGDVLYRAGPSMASSDRFTVVVEGEQTHGAYPWRGVDPITVAAQIVLGLQTIPSRQLDLTKTPSVISVGSIAGGLRSNIIPDSVELVGTIRTFDDGVRHQIFERIQTTVMKIAEASGASARLVIEAGYPVVVNDPPLVEAMLPTLARVAGREHLRERSMVLGAEDFAYYQQQIPGMFFYLGIVPPEVPLAEAPSNHSPRFFADERALTLGVRAMTNLAVDYLTAAGSRSLQDP